MRTSYTINYKLKYFEIDDDKTDIYKEVKNSRNRSLEHFLLAKSNQQQIRQAFRLSVVDVCIFSKLDVPDDFSRPTEGKIACQAQDNNKSDLLNHVFRY